MRRARKTIEVFSISAIDLFAGAMGAFALIAILLFPSYLKVSKTMADVDRMAQTVAQLRKDNAALQRQMEAMRTTVFLGLVTRAKSFVFLVDMSDSMKAYNPIIERTMREMIAKLSDEHEFQIIGFHDASQGPSFPAWQKGSATVAATKANKADALAFLSSIYAKFSGATPTHGALDLALATNVEAVILLSDGNPTDAPGDEIITDITKKNGGKKAIYTVAIGDYGSAELLAFLQGLAQRNNGGYVRISN